MKHFNQSKQSKSEYLKDNLFAKFMMGDPKKVFTKEELCEIFRLDERTIREKIAELANYVPVVALSSSKGYRVLSFNDDAEVKELVELYELCNHQVNDFKSRIDNLKARMKPLIALQKVIEKKCGELIDKNDK